MVDNITLNANGRHEMAFSGSRGDIWHRHGQQVDGSQPLEHWLKAANLDWNASKRQAYILLDGQPKPVDGQFFIARDDNDFVLSPSVTDQYKIHHVAELAQTFQEYISVDPRFQFSAMGSILGGRQIWFCAQFNGETTVGGDAHKSYLLSTTSFDKSQATAANISMVRSVCQNTIRAALRDTRALVRSTHRTSYDAKRVAQELAALASNVEAYKAVGDAMAAVALAGQDVSDFFKSLLDIPFDAKRENVSTRKFNQFEALKTAYRSTVNEGTDKGTVWTALQAVTRYVDHDRSVRANGTDEAQARFVAANFGSGDDFKQKAWNLLFPLVKDRVAVAA